MSRSLRFALRPGWLTLHVVTVALVVAMALLGRWQLDVSNSKHFSLQNFGYAIQWWLFATFTLGMWARLMRDAARRGGAPPPSAEAQRIAGEAERVAEGGRPVAYRRYVMPAAQPAAADSVHSAYNDYLARLAAADGEPELASGLEEGR
ncbi:hypothetical protein [uncultured Jatrophihabitans sp.]|uniref:hypothetical protein n=1 Tax=uncultured Jatrophihabitans sp. TaxID=1610747 RepID=UPI0035CA4565